jgi:primary-amine oxidase
MRIKLVLIMALAGIAAVIWFINQNDSSMSPQVSVASVSPWDSLSGAEIEEAAAAVKARHGDKIMLSQISLRQPEKSIALKWRDGETAQRGADISFRADYQSFHASYDFATQSLAKSQRLTQGQPMLSSSGELTPAVEAVNANEQVLAALAKRDIEAGDGLCLPRTLGRFFADKADTTKDRLLRFDCFYIAGQSGLGILPSNNAFGRPVEGITVLYDIERNKVIEINDSFAGKPYPPHDIEAIEYYDGALETRPTVKPVKLSRPQGHNFVVRGSRVDWQGWQFRLRFDPRLGTVLNRVGHATPEGFRSVAYEIAMAEMFVPYQDSDPNWFYRTYFDMGEFGLCNMSTALQENDCPSHALFQDVTAHTAGGQAAKMENRYCIFEHDPGYPIWRHHESLYDGIPGMSPHQSRSNTELIVRMVATIGNYDYFQDYVFQQDGRLRIRLVATGVDAVKGVFARTMADPTAADETAAGALIAPHILGVNHDHFFGYRIDMDIDGQANNFTRHKLHPVVQENGAPRKGIWAVTPEAVKTEKQAQTKMMVDKPALLVFSSADKKNAMGYATGYQIMMPNVRPLVPLDDETYQRALFVANNLWVTRFNRDELYASGLAVNQSGPGLGLPSYVQDDQNIENNDIVAWPTIGFHHVPMAEDWPVMPAKVDEIILKPRNYFDRNPAIDLAP